MNTICLKCNKKGKFGYFDTPDETGVVGVFTHKTGKYEKVKDLFGNERLVEKTEHHFVTLEELKQTDWYNKFKKEYDEAMKKHSIDMDKLYEKQYWESVKKEM